MKRTNPWLLQIGRALGCQSADEPLAYLGFLDWFSSIGHRDRDWVTVAESSEDARGNWGTFSALAAGWRLNFDALFSTDGWDVDVTLGQPGFWSSGDDDYRYDDGRFKQKGSLVFEPFVLYSAYHPDEPPRYDLTHEFLAYHACYDATTRQTHERTDEAGDVVPVAKYQRGKPRWIKVDLHHLRDYLAAKEAVLVRYHDHRRFAPVSDDVEAWLAGEKHRTIRSTVGSRHFALTIGKHWGKEGYFSRLLGKEIFLPYDEPDRRHWGLQEDVHEAFIYDRGDNGELLTASCDQEAADRSPGFLTPVFFTRDVLTQYYAEPSKYRVEPGRLVCGPFWGLPIDINDEQLVQVWLGDLGEIPHKHQLHWRQFNVPPRGGITAGRYRRDILAEWAGPDNSPAFHLRQALEDVRRLAGEHLGGPLFKPVDDRDDYVSSVLREPLTEEWQELDLLIQSLCKLTVESLDVTLLQRLSGRQIDGAQIKGSLDLLVAWLARAAGVDGRQIVEPFRMLQNLRSTGVAHRKGKKFDKVLEAYAMQDQSNAQRFSFVIAEVTRSLRSLSVAITEVEDLRVVAASPSPVAPAAPAAAKTPRGTAKATGGSKGRGRKTRST